MNFKSDVRASILYGSIFTREQSKLARAAQAACRSAPVNTGADNMDALVLVKYFKDTRASVLCASVLLGHF